MRVRVRATVRVRVGVRVTTPHHTTPHQACQGFVDSNDLPRESDPRPFRRGHPMEVLKYDDTTL
jgi:hypothetical protein